MYEVKIKLYSFYELQEDARRKALHEHRAFLIETYQDDEFDDCFNMTRSKYAKSLRKSDVIESIEVNEYLYFSNGELARTISYCGNHPKAGEQVFEFNGDEYPLTNLL